MTIDAKLTGAVLQSKRLSMGLSTKQLSEKMYVSRQTVYKWEGGFTLPRLDSLIMLSELYGCPIDDLIVRA